MRFGGACVRVCVCVARSESAGVQACKRGVLKCGLVVLWDGIPCFTLTAGTRAVSYGLHRATTLGRAEATAAERPGGVTTGGVLRVTGGLQRGGERREATFPAAAAATTTAAGLGTAGEYIPADYAQYTPADMPPPLFVGVPPPPGGQRLTGRLQSRGSSAGGGGGMFPNRPSSSRKYEVWEDEDENEEEYEEEEEVQQREQQEERERAHARYAAGEGEGDGGGRQPYEEQFQVRGNRGRARANRPLRPWDGRLGVECSCVGCYGSRREWTAQLARFGRLSGH